MSLIQLKYAPSTLIVDQTTRCNQQCFFCWRSDVGRVATLNAEAPIKQMPREMYEEIIDQGAEVETLRVLSLCGPLGDPLLVPDLADRGAYGRSKRFFTLINTNGYALDRHDTDALLMGFDSIIVSVDAVDPEIYRCIHGKDHGARVLENVSRLYARKKTRGGAEIAVRFTENEHNHDHWPEFQRYFTGRCDRINRKNVHTFVDHKAEAYYNEQGAIHCNQPTHTVNFDYLGRLTTCCINWHLEPTFGTLREGTLKELWEGEAFENWRAHRLEGLCKGCSGLGGWQRNKDVAVLRYGT